MEKRQGIFLHMSFLHMTFSDTHTIQQLVKLKTPQVK